MKAQFAAGSVLVRSWNQLSKTKGVCGGLEHQQIGNIQICFYSYSPTNSLIAW